VSIKTIILDFDGTIVESVGIKDRAFEAVFSDYPEHLNAIMEYHLCHNATVRFDKFRHITENILNQEYSKDAERTLARKFSELVFGRIVECPYVPGAKEFLCRFHRILPLYLASASPAIELDRILRARGIKKYFEGVYAIPWQKSNAIMHILKRKNISPEEAVFIGDASEDYEAAQSTGVPFIGRDSKKPFRGADIPIYEDLSEIGEVLSQLILS